MTEIIVGILFFLAGGIAGMLGVHYLKAYVFIVGVMLAIDGAALFVVGVLLLIGV